MRLNAAPLLRQPLQQQAHGGGVAWVLHHFGQTACVLRHAQPHRHVEDFLAQLDHAAHHGTAAGEDDARGEQLLVAAALQLGLDQLEELGDARLDDIGQRQP